MSTLWVDGDFESVGDVGYVIKSVNNNHRGAVKYRISDVPLRTNMSHQPRLYGWCGETNNISRTACGMARVVKVAKNGRLCLATLSGEDLQKALEATGYPELLPSS